MKTQIMCFSKLLRATGIAAFLAIGLGYTTVSDAAQGCGFGYHMTVYGRCVPNAPGPWASPAPGRPDCWYNYRGELRCYR